ncbi:MAG: hypothetical protein RMK29_08670 [Myxococcales bacterium]|nr:hypothetical protein [Myxococcota bacterium]MDW8281769.1 hypothetical protein [Myxococcales bacterium]
MRSVVVLSGLALLGLTSGLARAAQVQSDEQSSWALYAGPSPYGDGSSIFLVGESWTPLLLAGAPGDIPPGSQGYLVHRRQATRPLRQVKSFNPAEVPLRVEDLAVGDEEPAVLSGRPRPAAALLLIGLCGPGDKRVLTQLQFWRKKQELTAAEWAFLLRAGGFHRALAAEAKRDAHAAHQLLGQLWQEQRWAEARALLARSGKRIDPILAVRHDTAEVDCAPVRTARDQMAPTGLSWVQLLRAAALFAQGKRIDARRDLRKLLQRTPRLRESICLTAPVRLPDHELFVGERPRVLLFQVPEVARFLME